MQSSTTIQLFYCSLNTDLLDDCSASIVRSWLPENELTKVDRFIQQSAREQGLMVRGYLRAVLSQFADITPQQWQFEYGEKGKPRLSAAQYKQTGIQFNVSHSGEWLLIGVIQNTIDFNTNDSDTIAFKSADSVIAEQFGVDFGVDIERRRNSTNIHAILHHYFSSPEESALLALPENQQRERFFDLWSLKESYIKAKGLGLALSLKSFAFDLKNLQFCPLPVSHERLSVTHKVPDAHMASSTYKLLNKELLLSDNIPLSLLCETDTKQYVTASNWQCYLGRIDQTYRFAISVDCGAENKVVVKAKQVNFSDIF